MRDKPKTLGQIAEELGVAFHVARYAAQRHGVKCSGRLGIIRYFGPKEIEEIRQAIRQTTRNR